jgi:predicted dehydrogenase
MLYIALRPEHQLEYIEYGLNNDKHIICETPFLNSQEERKMIYDKIMEKQTSKVFHVNFPYIQDMDFIRYTRESMTANCKFVSIKASGPDTLNDSLKLKKLYSNQSINAVHFLHFLMGKEKFENFNIQDNYSGFISASNCLYEFSWEISDEPKLHIEFKNSENTTEKTIVYDQYDQIVPLLIGTSNKIYNIYPLPNMQSLGPDFWQKMNLTLYIHACTSEHFSDIFTNTSNYPYSLDDPLKLYFDGGLK